VIVIVSGPGGVGKGTIVDRVLEILPELWLSRSWTTRARRPTEADDAYTFVDEPTFQKRIDANGFLEWTRFAANGQLYGTPTIDADVAAGRDVLLEIELDGAQQTKTAHPEATLILVVAPSSEIQEQRLRGRGDDEATIARRLAVGAEEERLGRAIADYVVVNDEVDRAAGEVAGIIKDRRHSR
jgi:guanylate kinase